jgi:hypothetical protein
VGHALLGSEKLGQSYRQQVAKIAENKCLARAEKVEPTEVAIEKNGILDSGFEIFKK